jgi:glycosyltransferase involved in cell wall biosynthesis
MKVCDAVSALGHELKVFAPAEVHPIEWPELARHYGLHQRFPLEWLPSIRLLKRFDFMWYAHTAAQRFHPDLIYTWLPQSAALALGRGYPVVLEMHANVAGLLGAWWLRKFWNTGKRRRMLVTTQALRKTLERSAGLSFPDESVQVAPNGVDLERYAMLREPDRARRELTLHEGFTIGFTGHFYAGRGLDLLFQLARELPHVNFLWVGGTPEAVEYWRGILNAEGIRNVTLTGFINNNHLPLYQEAADILLMPYSRSVSASSGQEIAEVINPMKMFEYMASQRPIITADLPVIREVLDESRAVFCPPDDVDAWKKAIERLSADGQERKRLAANARHEVEKHTWLARAELALNGLG